MLETDRSITCTAAPRGTSCEVGTCKRVDQTSIRNSVRSNVAGARSITANYWMTPTLLRQAGSNGDHVHMTKPISDLDGSYQTRFAQFPGPFVKFISSAAPTAASPAERLSAIGD